MEQKLEKGFIPVETEHVLNRSPAVEVYKSLKKELTRKYNSNKSLTMSFG